MARAEALADLFRANAALDRARMYFEFGRDFFVWSTFLSAIAVAGFLASLLSKKMRS
jgi:hypothetical protein